MKFRYWGVMEGFFKGYVFIGVVVDLIGICVVKVCFIVFNIDWFFYFRFYEFLLINFFVF